MGDAPGSLDVVADDADAAGGVTTMDGPRGRVSVLAVVPLSRRAVGTEEESNAGGIAADAGGVDDAGAVAGPTDMVAPGDETGVEGSEEEVLAAAALADPGDTESGRVGDLGSCKAGAPLVELVRSDAPGMESSHAGGLEDTSPSRSDAAAPAASVTRKGTGSLPAAMHAAHAKNVCALGSGAASADAAADGDVGGDATASPGAPVAAHRGTVSKRALSFERDSLHAMHCMQFSCTVNPHTDTTF